MPSKAVERVLMHLWAQDITFKGSDQHGYTACCPAHDDRNPSFKLDEGDDGRALVYCHAGCTLEEIAAALQIPLTDLFEPDPDKPVKREVVERYDYTDEHGELLFQVERLHPKGFRQRRPKGAGWEYSLGDTRRVIYRLPQVIEALKAGKGVVIVEGERDVHTLESKGQVATTCPGGAGKWRDSYSVIFKGAKVAVIQDMDAPDPKTGKRPGQEHAEQVKASLEAVGAQVTMLQPAVGKDVTDHVNAGLKLGALVRAGEHQSKERLRVLSAPEVMALPDPDQEGYLLGPLIYRGYRIVIGGHTGHGKTTFAMCMVASAVKGEDFLDPHWHGKGGLRALIVDVEQGTKSVKRVLREVGLDNNMNVRYLRVPDGLALDSDKDAIAFMEKTFVEGRYDLVLCDPLYKLHRGDANDTQAATELMRRFDDWRDRYGFSLILPMHCRKPAARASLSPHDLFGSSAYQWGAEVLLGLERPQTADDGSFSLFHLWKDRDGEVAETMPLNGKWGLMFDRLTGFRRAQKPKRLNARDVIHQLLKGADSPLTAYDIQSAWPADRVPKIRTIRSALEGIPGVTHNGEEGLMARAYQLPVSMFDQAEA
jgi:hypothetical protein